MISPPYKPETIQRFSLCTLACQVSEIRQFHGNISDIIESKEPGRSPALLPPNPSKNDKRNVINAKETSITYAESITSRSASDFLQNSLGEMRY